MPALFQSEHKTRDNFPITNLGPRKLAKVKRERRNKRIRVTEVVVTATHETEAGLQPPQTKMAIGVTPHERNLAVGDVVGISRFDEDSYV